MSWLKLSPGHKLKVGVTFEAPDDDFVIMTADPEIRAQASEGLMESESGSLDKIMGLNSMPVAQLTIHVKNPMIQGKSLFMTKDELRKHVHECLAVLKTMDDFAGDVDKHLETYRQRLRRTLGQ